MQGMGGQPAGADTGPDLEGARAALDQAIGLAGGNPQLLALLQQAQTALGGGQPPAGPPSPGGGPMNDMLRGR